MPNATAALMKRNLLQPRCAERAGPVTAALLFHGCSRISGTRREVSTGRFRPCLAIFLLEESLLDLLADVHHRSFGTGRTLAKVCSLGLRRPEVP